MSKLNTLEDLFVHELRDIYSAEKQITKALPKMAKAADNAELKAGFQTHLEQTRVQIQRLEQIFQQLGKSPKGEHCKGMEGLLIEGSKMIEEDAGEAVRDAGLIGSAQRVEHYEMAAYGTARTYAKMLGNQEAYDLLSQTLEEEKQTDLKLSELAETAVNLEAQTNPEGEGGNGEKSRAPKGKSSTAKSSKKTSGADKSSERSAGGAKGGGSAKATGAQASSKGTAPAKSGADGAKSKASSSGAASAKGKKSQR